MVSSRVLPSQVPGSSLLANRSSQILRKRPHRTRSPAPMPRAKRRDGQPVKPKRKPDEGKPGEGGEIDPGLLGLEGA